MNIFSNRMNSQIAKFLSAFIPSRESRRRFRRLHAASKAPSLTLRDGGTVYYPIYNPSAAMPREEPELYDAAGRRLHTIFFRDFHVSHAPMYAGGRLVLDRYNYGLRHHLYTHRAMLETMGSPDYRYGALTETMGVVPDDYEIFNENPGLEKDFDRIFTYSRRLLERLPNAAFVPFCAGLKLALGCSREVADALVTEGLADRKTKNVSILSSAKRMCPLHELRIETAKRLRRLGLADAYGTFDPSLGYVKAYDTLADYRFSVVFENSVEDYCFTEKLTNCFACQTIPIYIGPPGVGDFFNTDGMICLSPDQARDIERALRGATPEFYAERRAAVLDNYRRVQRYRDANDYMFEECLRKDFPDE